MTINEKWRNAARLVAAGRPAGERMVLIVKLEWWADVAQFKSLLSSGAWYIISLGLANNPSDLRLKREFSH